MTTTARTDTIRSSLLRNLSGALYRRPRLVLGALLAPPVLGLFGIYLGALALMFISSVWHLDPPTSAIVREPSLATFQDVLNPDKPYLQVAQHTVSLALIVTLVDAALAFPLAYYMARIATGRTRRVLFILATL